MDVGVTQHDVPQHREPIFNVPAPVVAIVVACVVVHLVRIYLLTEEQDFDFLVAFAFNPARYNDVLAARYHLSDWWAPDAWTFITYAFIHGDATHLIVNTVWLLPFGAAVARRFGTGRFLAFFAVTAAAGAVAHLVTHLDEPQWMIGASGSISGFMAAAARFAFQHGRPLSVFRVGEDETYRVPAAPLLVALRDRRVVFFVGAWFVVNIVFGLGAVAVPGVEQAIAWQAHIGGFVAGLILFPLFDPIAPPRIDAGDADGIGGENPEPPLQ
jgi:membrane associated rhomboid family serine protease